MFLEQRINMFFPPQFALAAAGCLGTSQKYQIDRTWPIEEILLFVNFTVGTALTLVAAPATPDQFDNILSILQHVNLTVNDGKQPRSVVDCDGPALLEYASLAGFNNSADTLWLAAQSRKATVPATSSYSLCYRIPMVEPWMGEPLRSRCYLPVHTMPQDPVLTLTWQSLANMASAGTITNLTTEVILVRRVPTAESEKMLQAKRGTNPNGYIDWDLIETPFSVAPGIGTEQRFPLPIPGEYANLMFRQYLGGATVTRNVIDATGIGDTIANGFTNEQRWRLETASNVVREWRWKHLRSICDMSRPLYWALQTPSSGTISANQGVFDGDIIASTNFRAGSSVMLNFLTDGLSGDNASELGSLLDCNTPANNGLKMELIGTPKSVATNASYIKVMGRRLFGDLSRWQRFS